MKKRGLALAMTLCMSACSDGQPKAPDLKSILLDAKLVCQKFVKRHLRAPSTAEFPVLSELQAVPMASGSSYLVIGYVDSQNGFGAMIRSTFRCAIMPAGDKWELVDLRVAP